MPHRNVSSNIRKHARALRSGMTDAERIIWSRLRAHRLDGVAFRRQVPVGRYIVDFASLGRKTIVEIDGGQHAGSIADEERDAWLRSEGFTVLRFWNNEVLSNIDGVLEQIVNSLPPSLTLPRRGGGNPAPAAR